MAANERVWIMNHAAALAGSPQCTLGSFGNGFGHDTGEFTALDMITVDSQGNAYTAEIDRWPAPASVPR